MNNEELKPCPFCGGEAEIFGHTASWGAICTKCGSCNRQGSKTEAEAIAAWNRRDYLTEEIQSRLKKLGYYEEEAGGASVAYLLAENRYLRKALVDLKNAKVNYPEKQDSSKLTYADVEKMVKLNYHEYKEPRYCYWGETDSIAGMYFKIKTVDGADDLPALAIELYKEDEDGSIDFLTDYQTLHSAIEAAQEFLVDLVAAALGVERSGK